jgi:hypothetical protein
VVQYNLDDWVHKLFLLPENESLLEFLHEENYLDVRHTVAISMTHRKEVIGAQEEYLENLVQTSQGDRRVLVV